MTVITLPRSAIKEMNDEYIKVDIDLRKIRKAYGELEGIKNARGILKQKKVEDLLKSVEQSRSEWERI